MNRMQIQAEELVDSFYVVSDFALDFAKEPSVLAEPEKQLLIKKQLKLLKNGLNEAESLALLSEYVSGIEEEHQKLLQENELLRVELVHIHNLLKIDDQQDLDELKRQREFDDEMRELDELLGQDIQFESDVCMTSEPQLANEITESSRDDCPDMLTSVAVNYFEQYLNDGRFDVAVPLCKSVIAETTPDSSQDPLGLAALMQILALYYRNEHRFGKAATVLKTVLEIYDSKLNEDNPLILATLQDLYYMYAQSNIYDEAEPLCRRAVELSRSLFNSTKTETSRHYLSQQLNNMAIVYEKLQNTDLAAEYYRESMNVYEQIVPVNDEYIVQENRKRVAENTLHQQYPKKANIQENFNDTMVEAIFRAYETPECTGHKAMCTCECCEKIEEEERQKMRLQLVLIGLPEKHNNQLITDLHDIVYKIGKFHNVRIEASDLTSVHRLGVMQHDYNRSVIITFKDEKLCKKLFVENMLARQRLSLKDIIPDITESGGKMFINDGVTKNCRKLIQRCAMLKRAKIIHQFKALDSRMHIKKTVHSEFKIVNVAEIVELERILYHPV